MIKRVALTGEKMCLKCLVTKPHSHFRFKILSVRRRFSNLCNDCKEIRKHEGAEYKKTWKKKNAHRVAENARKIRKLHPERARAHSAAWKNRNPEKVKEGEARRYHSNLVVERQRSAKWAKANQEHVKRRAAAWQKRNAEVCAAISAKRRAFKLVATVEWRNDFFIREIYDLSKRRSEATGFKWHVDHIVPLNNALVCGLHVEHNLQIIPGAANVSKGNRLWPDMPQC